MIEPTEVPALEVHQSTNWRTLVLVLAAALMVTNLILLGMWLRLSNLASSNARAVDILVDATSPEAKARADKATNTAILQIDCNNRAAIQAVIDGLARQGLLQPGAVDVLTDQCKEQK